MEFTLHREGTRLTGIDWNRGETAVLFLHGLAGHAGEWADSARGLPTDIRSVAFDLRGHGRSERHPSDVSLDSHVADAAFVAEKRELAPAIVVGQSFGGLVAMLLAARRPDLVTGLVLIEADPCKGSDASLEEVSAWLRSWPVPFGDRDEAGRFFGGSPTAAATWAEGLEKRQDGLWPAFSADVLEAMLRDAFARDYWSDWAAVGCPALVVRGAQGQLEFEVVKRMVADSTSATGAGITDAGHDAHLDQPGRWQDILSAFVMRTASDA